MISPDTYTDADYGTLTAWEWEILYGETEDDDGGE